MNTPSLAPPTLQGKKGLVVGIANEHSIAWGAACAFKAWGAELAVTYASDKAAPYVQPLAERLQASLFMPCDVQQPAQIDALFAALNAKWGRLDFLLHSIAFAPKADLHGRVTDCSADGFLHAMDVSCHSFLRLARAAEPLMTDGGSLLTVSYYGSEKVVNHYGVMGVVKAALEASVRYLAVEMGSRSIRVNALSPGAMATRAASGLPHFEELLEQSRRKAPLGRLSTPSDVGQMAAFLCSDAARNITGGVHYIDGGYEVVD
jgi:enoyl-[acyl-carrier protein] reductase I